MSWRVAGSGLRSGCRLLKGEGLSAITSRVDTCPRADARYHAKLAAPRPRGAIIERPRLIATLADNRTPLTLLSAPPGFGKTSLAATWVASSSAPQCAWVTVDADDNSGGRFW